MKTYILTNINQTCANYSLHSNTLRNLLEMALGIKLISSQHGSIIHGDLTITHNQGNHTIIIHLYELTDQPLFPNNIVNQIVTMPTDQQLKIILGL